MVIVRSERSEDAATVHLVNEQAFGSPEEADLVDALRRRGAVSLSLVAEVDDNIVGHILFTPVVIESPGSSFDAVAIGPMAVMPDHQNKGIGSKLVREGLDKCGKSGHEVVVVLGHPNFYPRFGFKPANSFGIKCEFDVPDEAFMVVELKEGALANRVGTVKYQPEFSAV